MNGANIPPTFKPVETKPNTAPIDSFGATFLTNKSREGAVTPDINPAKLIIHKICNKFKLLIEREIIAIPEIKFPPIAMKIFFPVLSLRKPPNKIPKLVKDKNIVRQRFACDKAIS